MSHKTVNAPYEKDLPNKIYKSLFNYSSSPLVTEQEEGVDRIIIEVAQEEGLDVLGVYMDGSIKYINHSGSLSLLGSPNTLTPQALKIIKQAKQVPWKPFKGDLPPTKTGEAKLIKISAKAMSIHEGSFKQLSGERFSSPVILSAGILIHSIANLVNQTS
jgi:hypothetical protein